MTNLKKIEELTKALQDGKTLVDEKGNVTIKMINGVICKFVNNQIKWINDCFDFESYKIQEPEPEFTITENQLAEYECRNGLKAVCCGIHDNTDYPHCVLYNDGKVDAVTSKGRLNTKYEKPKDLIRKIRDL